MSIYAVRGRPRAVRQRIWLAIAAAVAAVTLAGCGGGAAHESAPAVRAGGQAAPDSYAGGAEDGAASARGESGEGSGTAGSDVKIVPKDRAIVHTAEMTVRADDVAAAADKAKRLVLAAGGYVADERSDSSSEDGSSATIVFKVPPDRYPTVVTQLGRDLGKRETLRQNAEDVTEQVADVESRVRSAESALAQLRRLLTKAEKIGEILEIEREISTRTAELEALQARQKALAAQTSMTTVTLHLIGPAVVVPEEEDEPAGFLGGLATGWRALVASGKVAVTVLGVLLPWLVVFGVIAFAVRLALRRLRPRPAAPPQQPPYPPSPRDDPEDQPVPAGAGEHSAPPD